MTPPDRQRQRAVLAVELLLLALATALFALHYRHLAADFPNHSPWIDWSKYTDEGWYGIAAIRHLQTGHWFLPGDFNPAAALPVWPLLETLLFHFTGISVVAARALTVSVFGLSLVASYLLLHRAGTLPAAPAKTRRPLAPALAVLLLAANPFCYAFTRLAILEPLLILLTLLALLATTFIRPPRPAWPPLLALGLLIPLLILTKTTAVFLLPALFALLFATQGYRLRPFLRAALPVTLLAAALWTLYYLLLVRPHFLPDYLYLFSANAYTGITRENYRAVLVETLHDGLWFGSLLYPAALIAVALSLLTFTRSLRRPILPALLLWAFGYLVFLAYHNNLQPRYYLVVAIPLTLLTAVVAEDLAQDLIDRTTLPALKIAALTAAACLFALILLPDTRQTLHYLRTPDYTLVAAASQIRQVIRSDPSHNPLLLSISGAELSLITGLPSICDDFGTLELGDRVALYHPGWYASWNQVDDDKMDALAPLYHLKRVAAYPALDDPDRNLLILYRLDPPQPEPPRPHTKRPIPRLLRTRLGQQPTPSQLKH